ncbi:hypothetical protein BJV77DRAFT_405316 [Russula vinacea]|nr:hypothetical protein BJV77DRAFT_405316 [Russula vinacea]
MRPPSSGSRLTCEGRTARCGDTLLTDCALKYIKQHDSRTKTNIPRNRHRRRQAETHVRGHLNHFGRNFKFTIKPTFCNRTEPEPSQSACVNKQLQKKAKLKDKDKGVMIDGFSARCISTYPPIEKNSSCKQSSDSNEEGRLTLSPLSEKRSTLPKPESWGRMHVCQFIDWLKRGTAAKKKRLVQTRLKSKRTPHGDSECGKVWCNVESSPETRNKKADPELT